FNFGPTLLSWMEAEDPDTYAAVLEADRRSAERFGGHGSALAQVYNHTIMPLSHPRDKVTQVRWGIADFRRRFGRDPEGMWLPETAVDVESLEVLAEEGIDFTVLAPHQAARVRPVGEDGWSEVEEAGIDIGRPYVHKLPSGRTIAIFFYHGPISRAIAFERLLESGERFAARLLDAFDEGAIGPRLVHIATDGETYGHHHGHGEMALSYALRVIEEEEGVRLTNYGEFLELHPPTDEVEIVEDTSWSCVHGVERWRADCGCSTGGRMEWNQTWRAPLRKALDWLRDELAPRYESAARELLVDPWSARDAYVDVILDRSEASLDRFFAGHAARELDEAERVRALRLLELQRHAMLMYTSCGWFFDELSGIETVQVIQYAGRAVQLARALFGDEGIEEGFLSRLERARSNLPEKGDGRRVYREAVRPAMVDLKKVGAHYAVASLFEEFDEVDRVYCYRVERREERRHETGRARLLVGRTRVESVITREAEELAWAVLHLGDHNVVGGVREATERGRWEELVEEIVTDFDRAEYPAVIRLLDEHFAADEYSLRSLFRDEQRRIMKRILESSISRAAGEFGQIYENRAPLMRFLAELGLPPPRPFRMAADFTINTRLERSLTEEEPDFEAMRRLVAHAEREYVDLEEEELGYAARGMLERQVAAVEEAPEDPGALDELDRRVAFARELPFEVVLWGVQNAYWRLLRETAPGIRERAGAGDEDAARWLEVFDRLGERLGVAIEAEAEVAAGG
ncbi:MAG: DUF3536 domain-containing protein, partial [Gemmatimonadota bacterium]|nr:DUF3536 domain-containing protein [Gemmatimonadota bacterium]